MKIIVTHNSPDWDAITSVWLLKKYFPGWENAALRFVPAGTRLEERGIIGTDEVIHVDTGLGPLDHHQTSDMQICAASLTYQYIRNSKSRKYTVQTDKQKVKEEALKRIIQYVVALDHFQEVFWPDAAANYHEFGFFGILEGYKTQYPNQDAEYVTFGITLLDAMVHRMEEVIWAEREITGKAKHFHTRFGKGLGVETLNDDTIKLAQKMGYVVVIRKDPRKGYVRIKCLPERAQIGVKSQELHAKRSPLNAEGIDLTLIKEQLSKMDPEATWFLHISKKMLLNGTPKNPKMIPTTLSLQQIINVVERI